MAGDAVLTITEENFEQEVKNDDLPVLIDFWAPWCGPCKMVGPVVEELAEDFKGRLKVGKLNTDDNQNIAVQYSIQSIPSLVLVKGGEEVDRMIGSRPKETIAEWINSKIEPE